MTNYLTLTKTEETDKVGFAMSYITSDALDWYMANQTTLATGTFGEFKTLLRDHFVPQNYKSTTYSQYKVLKQGSLSVSEYSGKMKSLADQIPELITPATRDIDFVEGLFHDIKRFIVSQPPVKNETWMELVGRALRLEETLPRGYQHASNRSPPMSSGPRRGPPQFTQSDRSGNTDRAGHSDRSSNWRQKSTTAAPSASTTPAPSAPLEPLSESDRKFLIKHKGCFRCRKTFIKHTWRTCDPEENATVENSGLTKEVKQEVNFISEADYQAEYQCEDSEQCQVVPPIVLPIQLDDQITTRGLLDCGSTSDFLSQRLVNRNPTAL